MALHNDFGKEAEQMAVEWLQQNGYGILHRNWRYLQFEIDIVAKKNDMLRVIEVKALQSSGVCYPEQSVTKKKFRAVQKAADEFIYQHPEYTDLRFEILSILVRPGMEPEFLLIEDVFL